MSSAQANAAAPGDIRSLLVSGSLGTAALHVAARALGFATTLVLAVALGAAGYGAFAWVMAWVLILRAPVTLGRDRLVVREVAKDATRGDWARVRGVLENARRVTALSSVCLTLALLGVVLAVDSASPLLSALEVGVLLIPLVALTTVDQAGLTGFHRVVSAQAPEALLRPIVFLVALGLLALGSDGHVSAEAALLLQAGAWLAALAAAARLLRFHLPAGVRSSKPRLDTHAWNRSGGTLAVASVLAIVQQRIDVVIVGVLMGAAGAGVYAVAAAAASLTMIVYSAVTVPLGPIVARLHAEHDRKRLARVLTRSTRALFGAMLVAGAALSLAAPFGLGLLGDTFRDGAGVLALLCLAAVVNSAAASNTLVLVMCGRERDATLASGLGAAVAVAGCFALIPPLGIEGGAIAMVVSTLARNAAASWLAWTRLGLDTTPIGRFSATPSTSAARP